MGILDPQYLDAIKSFEGYADKPFWDYKQTTSGYGTKAQPGDENLSPEQRKEVYQQRFESEIGNAAAAVDKFAPNLPSGTRAALVSLTFNAGPGWMASGLGNAIRQGDFNTAQSIFQQYNKAGGQVNQGLVNRRAAEAAWFGNGLPAAAQPAPAMTAQAAPPVSSGMSSGPYFPPQAQQPQAAPEPAPSYLSQIPAEQASANLLPPIFSQQRKPVNISALRAALQNAGNRGFYRG